MKDDVNANILIVDDKPQNLISLEAVLEGPGITFVKAHSGNEALSKILESEFALVLLDVQMPDMDGFETAVYLRGNKKTRHVPIIFVTAISKDKKYIFKGYESGAVDYILKPLDPDILINKVKIFLDLYRQKKIIEQKNCELEKATQEILNQQQALIEEERSMVLLQMAGAAAFDLNQPLMKLLGNLEMLDKVKGSPDKVKDLIPKIQTVGDSIVKTINKIQRVRVYGQVSHDVKKKITNAEKDVHILSVEDSNWHYDLFNTLLEKNDYMKLQQAESVKKAITMLQQFDFDLILLDYQLPDGTGLDFFEKFNSMNLEIPVIVITGKGDEKIASNCLKAGAIDYLPKKEISKDRLQEMINKALEKHSFQREINRFIKKLAEDSTRDQLTGLHNRRYMSSVLKSEIERVRRYKGILGCIIMDLDHFKNVNDTHGHLCGDYILQEIAQLFSSLKREQDHLFRYGGEEFVFLLPQTDPDGTMEFAERVRKGCEEKVYKYGNITLKITLSIGISSYNNETEGHELTLIDNADKALYEAKVNGRNCVRVYPFHRKDHSL